MPGHLQINAERCKGCSLCVSVCPPNILSIGEVVNAKGHYAVQMTEAERCIGCAFCALICPDVAIQVFRTDRKGE